MGALRDLMNVIIAFILRVSRLVRTLKVKIGLMTVTDGQYNLFHYNGYLISHVLTNEKRLDYVCNYDNFCNDDVIVLAYPKAGMHFLGSVVYSMYYEAGLIPRMKDHVFGTKPIEYSFDRKDAATELEAQNNPRLIATHLPWRLLPPKVREHKVKVIHLIRNPKDVACSAYPFFKKVVTLTQDTTWSQFLEYFTNNRIMGGDYFEFIRDWYPHRNAENNLTVYYEDMVQDLASCVSQISKFLNIQLSDEQIARVVLMNTFQNVRKQVGNSVIHRQGKSGTWKAQLTVDQNEMMDRWIERNMQDLQELHIRYE